MHEYDVALKAVLTRGASGFLSQLTGLEVAIWHNTELPEVRTRRADLIGETVDGRLIHIELQSTNDARMAFRMLDYLVAIERTLRRVPRQLVLYVGEAPLRMDNQVVHEGLSFQCSIRDIRELDGEPLLASDSLDDNMISILAGLRDGRRAVRRILDKIAAAAPTRRAVLVKELTILAGLRSLADVVTEETQRMPILNDIMDHQVFGPLIRKSMAEGRVEGLVEGRAEGRVEGERTILLRQIAKRFGSVPQWATDSLESLGAHELEELGLRLLDAQTLEDLFR